MLKRIKNKDCKTNLKIINIINLIIITIETKIQMNKTTPILQVSHSNKNNKAKTAVNKNINKPNCNKANMKCCKAV